MKRLALVILLPVLLIYGCYKQAYSHDVYEFHFRRTVVIDTPNGEVRGSTVSKITFQHTDGALVVPAAKGFGGDVWRGVHSARDHAGGDG